MRLEQSFQVNAAIERVWEALIEPQRVAPCLPGAELSEGGEDGVYRGGFTVKLGPTTASYRGELEMQSIDEPARRVVMRASGQDRRGQGSAKATVESVMRAEGDTTTVDVVTDFTITGRLARFGRGGMIQDVSNRLLRDFSACLAEMIEQGGAAEQASSVARATESGAAAPAAESGAATPAAEAGAAARAAEAGAAMPAAGAGQPALASPSPASPAVTGPQPARTGAKPVKGLSLLVSVLLERLKRLLRRRP